MLLLTGVAVMCAFTSPYYGAGKPKAETAAETEAKTDKTEGVTEKVKGVASETEADTEANTEVTPQDVKKKIESITDIALGLEETEADVAETETEKEVKKPKSVLKDVKWIDFEIAIDEEIMEFPLSVSSLKEGGWLIEAAYKGTELQPYSYIEAQAKKGEHIAYFYIANMTDRPAIADDSTVVGIMNMRGTMQKSIQRALQMALR